MKCLVVFGIALVALNSVFAKESSEEVGENGSSDTDVVVKDGKIQGTFKFVKGVGYEIKENDGYMDYCLKFNLVIYHKLCAGIKYYEDVDGSEVLKYRLRYKKLVFKSGEIAMRQKISTCHTVLKQKLCVKDFQFQQSVSDEGRRLKGFCFKGLYRNENLGFQVCATFENNKMVDHEVKKIDYDAKDDKSNEEIASKFDQNMCP